MILCLNEIITIGPGLDMLCRNSAINYTGACTFSWQENEMVFSRNVGKMAFEEDKLKPVM